MAQINLENIKKIDKNRNSIHDKVYTTYTILGKMVISTFNLIHTVGLIEKTQRRLVSQYSSTKKQLGF